MRRTLIAAAVVVAGLGGVFAFREELYSLYARPDGAFTPPPPSSGVDYALPSSWVARPETARAVLGEPPALDPADTDPAPRVAVFFIHPTTYYEGPSWNAPLVQEGDGREALDGVMRHQASAFAGCCRIFAPRYRQAHLRAFEAPGRDSYAALDLAYHDVERAFDRFVATEGDGPFILAAHSQGTLHAFRLLARRIAGTPLRARLAAAYLAGYRVPAWLREAGVPRCRGAADTGCFVAWQTVSRTPHTRTSPDPLWSPSGGYRVDAPEEPGCTNPLSWSTDDASADANPGALDFAPPGAAAPPALQARVTGARCRGPWLEITAPPQGFSGLVLAGTDYHVYDYNLFWLSVRRNAIARSAAALRARCQGAGAVRN